MKAALSGLSLFQNLHATRLIPSSVPKAHSTRCGKSFSRLSCIKVSVGVLKMRIANHVQYALDDFDLGRHDSALLHACMAIDGTARRMFPNDNNSSRYKKCLRHFYWILEPALGTGIDLTKTKFSYLTIGKNNEPDFADIVYSVFRCAHAHADEVPPEFELILGGDSERYWQMSANSLNLPHTVIFALLFVAVFAPVNKDETPLPSYWLTLGSGEHKNSFHLSESWGKSAFLQPIALKHNSVKVHMTFPPGSFEPKPYAPAVVGRIQIDLTPKSSSSNDQ